MSAEYQLLENLAFRVTYLLEDLKTQDWAYDGVGPTTLDQVLEESDVLILGAPHRA